MIVVFERFSLSKKGGHMAARRGWLAPTSVTE